MRDLIKLFRPGLVVFAVTLSSLAATTSVASMAAVQAAPGGAVCATTQPVGGGSVEEPG